MPNEYEIKDFRPIMRLADQDMSITELPKYEILEDCKILSEQSIYVIPRGFITDGASVPILGRSFFPAMNKYFGAAVAHDYYCGVANANGLYAYREKADKEFYGNLIECGTNKTRAKLMSYAVRAYGKMLKASGKLK
jgi:hypothetical protein